MAAISRPFVIFRRQPNILADTVAVLEAETEVVCTARVAAVCRPFVMLRSKSDIRLNPDSSFQADPKIVDSVRIS
jgi:hypothetical protein